MKKAHETAEGYWSVIEPVWLALNSSWDDCGQDFVRLFRAIRPEIGHLYAAHWCQSEVRNGGFHQFFFNTTGILAPEAVAGFRAIGLTELADVVTAAMEFFGSPYPRQRTVRQEILPARQGRQRREQWDPFYLLDERFYESVDRWEDAADAYAARVRVET
jgi:hypothetical protein